MSLNIRPIFSALLRNRTGAVLVALQIAIALAVLANAVFIVMQRVAKIDTPTGMDIPNIFVVSSSGFGSGFQYVPSIRADLEYLRGLDGVVAVTPINSIPLGSGGEQTPLSATPGTHNSPIMGNLFEIDEQGVDALGLHIIAGRAFRRDDILPPLTKETAASLWVPQIIVSQALASALFPDTKEAIGKIVYNPVGNAARIIGIVDTMQGSWTEFPHNDRVYLAPRLPFTYSASMFYLVRVKPGRRDSLLAAVERHMATSNPNRVINWVRTFESYKERSYRADHNMEIFLVTVTGLLLAITALGIFGLATFNVSVRTKQIGTRRAVGARRLDIVRYFMIENALITTGGVVSGCALALGVGYWLSLQYGLPRLNLYYLVGGLLALWVIGQLAVWQPARKASAISPSVATRTV